MTEDTSYLSKIIIDVCSRSILLISNENHKKIIKCNTTKEFMNALEFCRSAEEFVDEISYAKVLVASENWKTGKVIFYGPVVQLAGDTKLKICTVRVRISLRLLEFTL